MTTLTLNPDKLDAAIKNIKDLTSRAAFVRLGISLNYGDVDGIDATSFFGRATKAIDAVRERTSEISTVKQTIIDLNSNGIAMRDGNGNVSVTIPDGTSINSVTELKTWGTAAIDAKDLEKLTKLGESSDPTMTPSRPLEEVIASIRAHKGNPVYANALIDMIGPENLTSLPLDMKSTDDRIKASSTTSGSYYRTELYPDLAKALGETLAPASTTWDDERCEEVSNALISSVSGAQNWGKMTVLNAMLGGHDANNDRVNDLTFNTKFLDKMATGLDKVYSDNRTWIDLLKNPRDYAQSPIIDHHLEGQSLNPLIGVLDAMTNNPQAAVNYLGTPGSDGTLKVQQLMGMDWDKEQDSLLIGAAAAASSLRDSHNSETADRATNITGNTIHTLSTTTSEDSYTDDTKARIALLMTNASPEMTQVFTGGNPTDPRTKQDIPSAQAEDFKKLAYRIVDNEDAAATLSAGISSFARDDSRYILDHTGKDEDRATKINAIKTAYHNGGEAIGYLAGLADTRAHVANEDKAGRSESARTALGVFSTILGGGLSGAAGTAWSVGSSISIPLVASDDLKIESTLGDAESKDLINESMGRAALEDAAKAGLLDPGDFDVLTPEQDAEYEWIDAKRGTIDFSKIPASGEEREEALRQINDWKNAVLHHNNSSNLGPNTGEKAIQRLEEDYTDRVDEGYRSGRDYREEE